MKPNQTPKHTFQKPARAWQRMLSGRRLDLLNPSPQDVDINDIAHGLARVARWNGQTKGDHAFSVAQHSLLVLDIYQNLDETNNKTHQLAALLHDSSEYVIGDLISPFKSAIGRDYKNFELKLLAAIYSHFNIPQLPDIVAANIKQADQIAAYLEATQLAGFSKDEAQTYFGQYDDWLLTFDNLQALLTPMPASDVTQLFLNRIHSIVEKT